MTASNLGVVFGPGIIRHEGDRKQINLEYLAAQNKAGLTEFEHQFDEILITLSVFVIRIILM
jgi:hypothetical protein